MRNLLLVLAVLVLSSSVSCAGDLKGMLKPFGSNTIIQLYLRDREGEWSETSKPLAVSKSGRFAQKSLQPGKYMLLVYSDGYACTEIGPFTITGDAKNLGVIHLDREARIVGRITPSASVDVYAVSRGSRRSFPYGRGEYAEVQADGTFVIDRLRAGKYELICQSPEILTSRKEVTVGVGQTVRVPTISIEKTGKIAGKITVPEGSEKQWWMVFAIKADDYQLCPPWPTEVSRWHQALKCNNATGEYTIEDLPAGRYRLSIIASGELVCGDRDLLKGEASEADASAIKGQIASLGDAFAKGDVDKARTMLAAKCTFPDEPSSDLEKFMKLGKEANAATGKREAFLLRSNGERALAYTRATEKADKNELGGLYSQMPYDPERIEKWTFTRVGSEWKLSEYVVESYLTGAINCFRLLDCPHDDEGVKKDVKPSEVPPPLKLVVTDDPTFVDIEVKAGKTSNGHDWTLVSPVKPSTPNQAPDGSSTAPTHSESR